MRAFRIAMLIVTVVCVLPLVSLLLSLAIANLAGCALDEGSVHPCVIAGFDFGTALYTMFVFTWLGLLTLPALGLALPLWGVVELVVRRRRRQTPHS
jgi:hypothetical protein